MTTPSAAPTDTPAVQPAQRIVQIDTVQQTRREAMAGPVLLPTGIANFYGDIITGAKDTLGLLADSDIASGSVSEKMILFPPMAVDTVRRNIAEFPSYDDVLRSHGYIGQPLSASANVFLEWDVQLLVKRMNTLVEQIRVLGSRILGIIEARVKIASAAEESPKNTTELEERTRENLTDMSRSVAYLEAALQKLELACRNGIEQDASDVTTREFVKWLVNEDLRKTLN